MTSTLAASGPQARPRPRLLVVVLACVVALIAAGCGGSEDDPESQSGAWSFVDDRGERIELADAPDSIVTYEAFLPALWEVGVRPAGVLASAPLADNPDIAPVAERLEIDLDDITELSTAYGEVNLEEMASLQPDVVLTYFNERSPVLYGFMDENMQDRAAELAPTIALDIHNEVPKELARVLELAGELGGDVDTAEVRTAKEQFEAASDRLRSLAKERAGMTVLAAVPVDDGIFVAAPSTYTFTGYLQDLGFEVFVPEDDSATVSWELVPTELTSDAVLLAAGADYPTNEELRGSHPTWGVHPAVAAGQVASVFPNVVIPSYGAVASLLENAGDSLEEFTPLG